MFLSFEILLTVLLGRWTSVLPSFIILSLESTLPSLIMIFYLSKYLDFGFTCSCKGAEIKTLSRHLEFYYRTFDALESTYSRLGVA
jgi:hypothetical protein